MRIFKKIEGDPHAKDRRRIRSMSSSDRLDYLEALTGQLSMAVMTARQVPAERDDALRMVCEMSVELRIVAQECVGQ